MTAHHCSEIGLKTTVSRFLENFHSDQPFGIAVSGGSDSTGLLIALSQLTAPDRLVALTVDHGLRSGSREEAVAVGQLCRRLGIRHEILQWKGEKPATGIQAAARNARYRLLSDAARKFQLGAIVTAHTVNDQAETLVMRKRRIAGDADWAKGWGMAGIPPATLYDETVWFVRPFLSVDRSAIRSFLGQNDIGWSDDPSNEDTRYERVRVRKAGPVLNRPYGRVWEARSEWSGSIATVLNGNVTRTENDCFYLETGDLTVAMVEATLAVLIDVAGGRSRGIDKNGRERLREFVSASAPATLTVGRTALSRKSDQIKLQRERRNIPRVELAPGDVVTWDGRYRISYPSTGNSDRPPVEVRGDHASGILPEFHVSGGNPANILVQRLSGRASRLLPVFEVAQANAIARICGRGPFPACPWRNWMISALV